MYALNTAHPANVSESESLDGQYVEQQVTASAIAVLFNDLSESGTQAEVREASRLSRFLQLMPSTDRPSMEKACKDYVSGFAKGSDERKVTSTRMAELRWIYTAASFPEAFSELQLLGYHSAVKYAKKYASEKGLNLKGEVARTEEQKEADAAKTYRKEAINELVEEGEEITAEAIAERSDRLARKDAEAKAAKQLEKVGKFAADLFTRHGASYCHALAQELLSLLQASDEDAPM